MLSAMAPAYRGAKLVQTFGPLGAYVEWWTPGSRARARVSRMRSAGLDPRTSIARSGHDDVVEIRIDPAPYLQRVPAVEAVDLVDAAPPDVRAKALKMRASVDTEEG